MNREMKGLVSERRQPECPGLLSVGSWVAAGLAPREAGLLTAPSACSPPAPTPREDAPLTHSRPAGEPGGGGDGQLGPSVMGC